MSQALRARFEAKPEDAAAFAAIEEALFVAGDWRELMNVYERRLAAADLAGGKQPKQRARVLLRRAQVQADRLRDEDAALATLREATLLDATLRPALTQLRALLAKRGDWDAALGCAEAEAKLPMRPSERAQLATEVGTLWLEKRGDPAKARDCYERALEAEASFAPALVGLANAAEATGAHADAARALERAAELLRGAERAAALSRLAKLQRERLGETARANENFRRALSDDPQQTDALEALAERALASQQWAQFDELQDRRFALAKDRLARLAIAHDAGRAQLEKAKNPSGARLWFKRALDLFPGDPVVHLYLADAARMLGEHDALATHLRRATELADNAAPVEALAESAKLARERGDEKLALAQLRRAFERDPQREDVAEQLSAALGQTGGDEEFVDWVEAQLATQPGASREAALWLQLGAHHEERRADAATAFDAYTQALDAEPAHERALHAFERVARKLERWEALVERLSAGATASQGAPRAALCVRLGQLHIEREDLDRARAAFESALEAEPQNPLARQGVERIALATGDHEAILASFEREAAATTDRERLAFLVGELAGIHEERGDLESALKWRQKLAMSRPEDAAVLNEVARLQRATGERAGEAATLARLDPLCAGAEQLAIRRRLAVLYAELGDVDGALRAQRALLALDANDLPAARAVVNLLDARASVDERAAALRHLVAVASGEERIARQYELGCLLMDEAGDLRGAGACLEAVVDAPNAPTDAEARFVDVLERLGQWDVVCARLDLRRRLLDPLDPLGLELDLERAEILIDRLGRTSDAIAVCDAVREVNPQHPRAREVLERALRASGDDARLVVLLEERARLEADRERKALLDMERAVLFEQRLKCLPDARNVLAEIAASGSAIAADAERKLRQLLENARDWAGLAERFSAALGRGDAADDVALHRQLATLHREHLHDVDGAISHLERALTLSPQDVSLLHALEALLEQSGRDAALCAAFERELALGAESERARLLHARCAELHERASDLARAEAHHRALLALDPRAAQSVQFLSERFERAGRLRELAEVLRAQLAQLAPDDPAVALRLRLAKLEADALGDIGRAIDTLAPAAARESTLALAAAPLAELLARAQRSEELIALAQRAAARAESAAERAAWRTRLGDAQRASGDLEAAADAYRRALSDRPADPDLQASLRDLYRQLQRTEPLARLLAAELGRTTGPKEVPLRLELGALLAGELGDPATALVHFRRALELEPANAEALERALSAAEQAGAHDASAALLAQAAARAVDPARRAQRLARRAALLAGPLARPEEAVTCYEEALALAPDASGTLAALRGVLEDRGDWPGLLACFERELAALPLAETNARVALIGEAARFANEMLGPEASLPWLERLAAARPEDVEPLARIAAVHRGAGNPEALLRTLERELALTPPGARRTELALEAAALWSDQLAAPAQASAVLESAREGSGEHPALLEALDRAYAEQQRTRERLGVAKARIARADAGTRLALRKSTAALARELGDRAESAAQLWCALAECGPISHERAELLRLLAADLADRPDLWARAAEAELAALEPGSAVFAERRRALRAQLAACYAERLGEPQAAIAHWTALLDRELPRGDGKLAGARAQASAALVDALRRVGDPVNLARRLHESLAETPGDDAKPWLELGRLHLEALHQPGAAAAAFEQARARDAGSLPALRGLRGACELLGRWREVASSLEAELSLRPDLQPTERAALLRRLGEVSWRRLDETTRASRAYASALEADAHDLVSLRALQLLFEAMEDWRGAIDLYESEVEVLAGALPARRRECWLRAADLAAQHANEPARALRCLDAAAEIAPLETPRVRQLAELLDALGDRERFVHAFAAWLDARDAEPHAHDELRLAAALERLERVGSALAYAERACGRDPQLGAAWDRAAELRERLGQREAAADALERAAELVNGAAAAQRRVRAADLLSVGAETRRTALLARATQEDALNPEAFAKLALAAAASGDVRRAEAAAERAIALSGEGHTLAPSLRRDAALCGARAALALDHPSAAARLLADVLALAPDHAEALAQYGRTLLRLGDVAGARSALSRALELARAPRERAALLAQLGSAEATARAVDTALAHFRAAIELEPQLGEAYAGLVPLLMSEQRDAEAVDALRAWATLEAPPSERAARLLQAAELELRRTGREAEAEELLRSALALDVGATTGWALLAELQASQGRWTQVVESAQRGAAATDDVALRSRLEALRGRACEQRGELRAAAEAFAAAARLSPRASEAALSAARLLRGLGEWRAAADVLRDFAGRAPDDAVSARAAALHQLGRLLAGPLEDVDGAVDVYREAATLSPDNRECAEALADLLLHRPRHWDEAVGRHRELLAADPTRLASLRGLLRVARGRGNTAGAAGGLVLLRSLGVATADEAREAPTRLPFAIAGRAVLANALFEGARKLAREGASELASALAGAAVSTGSTHSGDVSARFRAAVTAAEGELSAPCLVPLATPELASALVLLAELAADAPAVSSADGALVNALSRALGWRAKKRVKRALEGHSAEAIAGIDFTAWRLALRALASALVIDRGEFSLRDAFVAFIQTDDPEAARTLPPEADLRARVAAQPEALELLRLAAGAWAAAL